VCLRRTSVAIFFALCAASLRADDDALLMTAGDLAANQAEEWMSVATVLAQRGKWNAAADAQGRVVARLTLSTDANAESRIDSARLLLARYFLNSGDADEAAQTLATLTHSSRSARWLNAEVALARRDAAGALREIEAAASEGESDSGVPLSRLYCSAAPLLPHAIDELLRARAALASGDAEEALAHAERSIEEAPEFADARLARANAFDALRRAPDALEEIERIRRLQVAVPEGCPGIRMDRLLFNAGNIARDTDRGAAEGFYREAIADAVRREDALQHLAATLPRDSPLLFVLSPLLRPAAEVAPEARNNLGQLLLDRAVATASDAGIDEALHFLGDAAASHDYRTPQFAQLGIARARLARKDAYGALDSAGKALSIDPTYEDALDFVAAMASDSPPAISLLAGTLLLEYADLALPRQYVSSEYGTALDAASRQAASNDAEGAQHFLAALDLFNHEYASAQSRIAHASSEFASSTWPLALRARVEAETGAPSAGKSYDELFAAIRSHPPKNAWDAATIRAAAAINVGRASASGNDKDVENAQTLYAMASPDRPDVVHFPWSPRGGLSGIVATNDGSRLPGVDVTVIAQDGTKHTITTDAFGRYDIEVPPGSYEVIAELSGMSRASKHVVVDEVGTTLALSLGAGRLEEITVTGRKIEVPFTSATSQTYSLTDSSTFSEFRASTALISGGAAFDNHYLIDGVTVHDPFLAQTTNADLTQYASGISVGFAGPLASSADNEVSITTQDGNGSLQGAAEGNGQPESARAEAKPVAVPTARRDDLASRMLRASAGGPLIRDQLYVYLFGDLNSSTGRPSTDIASRTAAKERNAHLFGRITETHPKNFASLVVDRRDNRDDGIADDVAQVTFGAEPSIDRNATFTTTRFTLNGGQIVRSIAMSDYRFSTYDESSTLRPATSAGDAVQSRDANNRFFSTGGTGFINDGRTSRRNSGEWKGQVTFGNRIEHTVAAGVVYEADDDHLHDRLSGGTMIESGVSLAANGGTVRRTLYRYWADSNNRLVDHVDESFHSTATSTYLQDEVKIDRVTIEGGLRYARQHVGFPGDFALSTSLLQPRLGVAIDPVGDHRSIISASFARIATLLSPADIVAFGSSRRYAVSGLAVSNVSPIFDEVFSYGRLAGIDPNLKGKSEDELSLRAGMDFGSAHYVEILAVHRHLRNEIEDFFCTSTLQRCIGNPGSDNMDQFPQARAVTDKAQLRFWRNETPWIWRRTRLAWEADYVWQRRHGNIEAPDLESTRVLGIDPYSRPAFDTLALVPPDGPLAHVHRHTVRTWATATLSRFTASFVGTWISGEPRARFGYSDLYGRYVDYLEPRGGEGHSPSSLDLGVRVNYERPIGQALLRLGVSIDNLLNRQTPTIDDQAFNTFGQPSLKTNPTYLQPMTRLDPFTARFFARIVF
jgi:hypothetical protein